VARAHSKYLEDGINPVEHREVRTSQLTGVHWDKNKLKWRAVCKGTTLGYHATEENAARAYSKYLKDGIDPVERRGATNTSQFAGVCWNRSKSKWQVKCKGTYLGLHATENGAALAYTVGRPLNVIPPAGAVAASAGVGAGGGAGPKRGAPKTPSTPTTSKTTKRAAPTTPAASAPSKKMKL